MNLLPLGTRARRSRPSSQTRDFPADHYLVFATAQGQVKKTAFSEYDKSRREGFIAINLREGDELVRVVATARRRRPVRGDPQGHDHPLLRERRAGHGPRRRRGAGHPPARRTTRWSRCDVARDDADILHRHRRRLRQADQARAVQPPGPRRPGRAGHPAHRQAGPGGGGLHGRPGRRDPPGVERRAW